MNPSRLTREYIAASVLSYLTGLADPEAAKIASIPAAPLLFPLHVESCADRPLDVVWAPCDQLQLPGDICPTALKAFSKLCVGVIPFLLETIFKLSA
jgi:hypothetical protein